MGNKLGGAIGAFLVVNMLLLMCGNPGNEGQQFLLVVGSVMLGYSLSHDRAKP